MSLTLGDRIRRARESANMTQEAASERISVTSRTLIRYEQGKSVPKEYVLRELSELTGVRIDWLKTGEGPMRDSVVNEAAASNADAGREGAAEATRYLVFVADGKALVRIPLGTPEIIGDIEISGGFTIEEDR